MPPRGAPSPIRSLQACWPECLKGTFSHLAWTAKGGERLCYSGAKHATAAIELYAPSETLRCHS